MNPPEERSLPLEADAIREYLDEHIEYWERNRNLTVTRRRDIKCEAYVEAYQGMRVALFGERLTVDESRSL